MKMSIISKITLQTECNSFFLSLLIIVIEAGFPGGSDGQESICNAEDLALIPGLGRSPRGVHENPFQHSCLENPHGQWSLVGYSS